MSKGIDSLGVFFSSPSSPFSSHILMRLFIHSTIDTELRHDRMRLTFGLNNKRKERKNEENFLFSLALFETLRSKQRTSC